MGLPDAKAPRPRASGTRRSILINLSHTRIAESTRRRKADLTTLEVGRSA